MNSTELVSAVRLAGQLSTQDPTYTSTVILDEASQALIERFAEPVSKLRQGYWLHVQETATDVLANFVRIPPRALVQGLEKVEISEDNGANYKPLGILTQLQSGSLSPTEVGPPTHYTLEGDCIRLFPYPQSTSYLIRFTYYLRPPALVAYAASCVVSSSFFYAITVNTNPSLLGITAGSTVDIQNADGSHELAVVGATVTSVTGVGPYVINLDTEVETGRVRAGDIVRPADQAVYPMLPKELHRPLADYVAAVILTSKGDAEKASNLANKANNGIERVVNMANPRNKTGQFTWKSNSYLRNNVGRIRGWR